MTKKDYELIAAAFKKDIDFCRKGIEKEVKNRDYKNSLHTLEIFAGSMAQALQNTNPLFNAHRFLESCGLQAEAWKKWTE